MGALVAAAATAAQDRFAGKARRRGSVPPAVSTLRRVLGLMLVLLGLAGVALAQGTGAAVAEPSVWAKVTGFVVEPWATIALLVVGCLLIFIDLLTPLTWGMTGTLGVIAVGLVFASHVQNHTGGWIGIILLLGGVTFLLLETHVFPGHGVAAVVGLLLTFLGMFWSLGGSANALFALSVSAILTIVTLIAFFAYLPKSPIWKALGQQMRQHASLGYVANENKMFLLGRTGHALTVLRPAGLADIDGLRIDVITEGDFLDAGTPIIVSHVEGARVVVEKCEAGQRERRVPAPDDGERTAAAAA